MGFRAALHQAGAAALTQLLQFAVPAADQRSIPCPCGHQALSRELRSRRLLTALGEVELSRPYYLCALSSGAVSGRRGTGYRTHGVLARGAPHAGPGGPGCSLRSWPRTDQSPGRAAGDYQVCGAYRRSYGEDIARREREQIDKAIQLDLPAVLGKPIPVLHVEMDGTGVPVVKKETVGRQGKTDGQPAHSREVKLGCVFTQATCDKEGFLIRDPDSTTYTGAIETAEQFGKRIYLKAYQRGGENSAKKVVPADGAEWIWNLADLHFPARFKSSISTTPANTCGSWRVNYTPTMQ